MIKNLTDTQKMIVEVCEEVKNLLLIKNQDYGSSFNDPINIFSHSDPMEQTNVRIDDKLKRIKNNNLIIKEDTELDLIGHLILRKVLLKEKEKEKNNFKSFCEQNGHVKVYQIPPNGLASPSQYKWICYQCGELGTDAWDTCVQFSKVCFDYDTIYNKFNYSIITTEKEKINEKKL
jgi:hypothetical protein